MPSSRTGLAPHIHFRKRVLSRGKSQGVMRCPICTVELDYKVTRLPNSAEPDHIVPIARGGTNDVSNGRVICRRCNQRRGSKMQDPKPQQKRAAKVESSPIW